MGFEKHHQFDNDGADFFAYAASMAFYQVLLKRTEFVGRNILVHREPKPVVMPYNGSSEEAIFMVEVVTAFLDAELGFGS